MISITLKERDMILIIQTLLILVLYVLKILIKTLVVILVLSIVKNVDLILKNEFIDVNIILFI